MILASLSLAFACTESDETLFDRTEDHLSEPVESVVQERDPSLPAEPTRIGEISPSAVQGSEFIQPDDFIGRGYKIGNTMDARNQVPQVRVIPNISVIRDTVMALVVQTRQRTETSEERD